MKTLVGDKAPEPGRETTGNMGVFVCSGEELGLHLEGQVAYMQWVDTEGF